MALRDEDVFDRSGCLTCFQTISVPTDRVWKALAKRNMDGYVEDLGLAARDRAEPKHAMQAPFFRVKEHKMTHRVYQGDLPDDLNLGAIVAIDCETMGLHPHRDRLCVVQLSGGDGTAHLVQISQDQTDAPNLCALLANPSVLKLFHYGRFDIAALQHRFEVVTAPVYCTKIASKLVRTYTDRHGLKALLQELLNVDISKQQQSSDWGAASLTSAQVEYAASDVLYLHALKEKLDAMLAREGRADVAAACFGFLPTRAALDLAGWSEQDIFSH